MLNVLRISSGVRPLIMDATLAPYAALISSSGVKSEEMLKNLRDLLRGTAFDHGCNLGTRHQDKVCVPFLDYFRHLRVGKGLGNLGHWVVGVVCAETDNLWQHVAEVVGGNASVLGMIH